MKEKAVSLDLGGVVYRRFPVQLKALWHKLTRGETIYDSPTFLPEVYRQQEEKGLKVSEIPSFLIHKQRGVSEEVQSEIVLASNRVDIYGNTGRSNRTSWVVMTMHSLADRGILNAMQGVFFKPEGVRTKESKADAVRKLRKRYHHVVHIDDNPEDALFVAGVFPDVEIVIVQDLTTGLLFSQEEQRRFPNARRVATAAIALSEV